MIQYGTMTIWVGMDVHHASITAAILHGDSGEPQVVRLPRDLNAARRLFRRLAENGIPRACYKASGGFRADIAPPAGEDLLAQDQLNAFLGTDQERRPTT